MARPNKIIKTTKASEQGYLEKLEAEVSSNQSRLSLILGALIVLVAGVLVFNYFNKNGSEIGPATQTEGANQEDVSPESLPGKYTVKEDDTLFTIAEKYYKDGSKYTEIVKANSLTDENTIVVGQVLEIPKVELEVTTPVESMDQVTPTTAEFQLTPTPQELLQVTNMQNDWGQTITDNTYTVIEGDWLSTIAARAYGDPMAYQKIADANKISNPDLILPGQILVLPR